MYLLIGKMADFVVISSSSDLDLIDVFKAYCHIFSTVVELCNIFLE